MASVAHVAKLGLASWRGTAGSSTKRAVSVIATCSRPTAAQTTSVIASISLPCEWASAVPSTFWSASRWVTPTIRISEPAATGTSVARLRARVLDRTRKQMSAAAISIAPPRESVR